MMMMTLMMMRMKTLCGIINESWIKVKCPRVLFFRSSSQKQPNLCLFSYPELRDFLSLNRRQNQRKTWGKPHCHWFMTQVCWRGKKKATTVIRIQDYFFLSWGWGGGGGGGRGGGLLGSSANEKKRKELLLFWTLSVGYLGGLFCPVSLAMEGLLINYEGANKPNEPAHLHWPCILQFSQWQVQSKG